MPIYEYRCNTCSCKFDLKRSFSDDGSTADCPECGGDALRVFSPVPIIFKGSGFYVTDNRGNHSHSEPTDTGADLGKAKAVATKKETKKSVAKTDD